MTKRTCAILLGGVAFTLCCAPYVEAAPRRLVLDQPAIDIALQDADQKEFRLEETQGKVVILVVVAEADSKEGRQKNMKDCEKWIQLIKKKRYDDRVVLIGMIKFDVSYFFRGMVRKKIRKNLSIRFLIDWDGNVYKSFGDSTLPTIVVIDRNGYVRNIVKDKYSAESAERLFDQIDTTLHNGDVQ